MILLIWWPCVSDKSELVPVLNSQTACKSCKSSWGLCHVSPSYSRMSHLPSFLRKESISSSTSFYSAKEPILSLHMTKQLFSTDRPRIWVLLFASVAHPLFPNLVWTLQLNQTIPRLLLRSSPIALSYSQVHFPLWKRHTNGQSPPHKANCRHRSGLHRSRSALGKMPQADSSSDNSCFHGQSMLQHPSSHTPSLPYEYCTENYLTHLYCTLTTCLQGRIIPNQLKGCVDIEKLYFVSVFRELIFFFPLTVICPSVPV